MPEGSIPFKYPWVFKDALTVAGTDYVHIAIKQERGVNNYVNIPVAYELYIFYPIWMYRLTGRYIRRIMRFIS